MKQVNTNFSNVHDKLDLVLSTYTRVEEAQISIDIPNAIYNFLKLNKIKELYGYKYSHW